MHGIDRAVRGVGGGGRPERRVGDAEANLLAFHVAAGLQIARRLIDLEGGEGGIPLGLGPVASRESREKQDTHCREECPSLALVADHPTEGVGQRRADREDRPHLDEVADRIRILEGMSGVDVEEAAAVGAELLDRDLRGHRPLRDELLCPLKRRRLGISAKVLRHAGRDERERHDDRQRQHHVKRCAGEIDPEIADRLGRAPGKSANDGDHERNARGGGEEIVHREPGHLRQIAHGGLAAVGLPASASSGPTARARRRSSA